MNPLSFGLGVVAGFLLAVALAVALAWRDGHPFGDTPRDDRGPIESIPGVPPPLVTEGDGPPVNYDG
jgi:hypothetical protein